MGHNLNFFYYKYVIITPLNNTNNLTMFRSTKKHHSVSPSLWSSTSEQQSYSYMQQFCQPSSKELHLVHSWRRSGGYIGDRKCFRHHSFWSQLYFFLQGWKWSWSWTIQHQTNRSSMYVSHFKLICSIYPDGSNWLKCTNLQLMIQLYNGGFPS